MDDRRPGRREAPGAQDPAYRPARPPHASSPALKMDAVGLARGNALGTSPGFWVLAIPEVCPPGEGIAPEIDKIFWETKQG
jgi:hypothetical protein